MSKGVVVIGDCHGVYTTLVSLVVKIKEQFPESEIVFVADFVDRGPRSREVVQYIIENGYKSVKGNHEDLMSNYILFGDESNWEYNGGIQTLVSYEEFPMQLKTHAIWMSTLPLFLEFPDVKNEEGRYLVVSHSAIGDVWEDRNSPYKDEQRNFNTTVLWGRDLPKDVPEIYNIHGHSPFPDGPRITESWANIDTGAVFKRPHYGKLTGLHWPSLTVISQENIDV